VAGRARACDPWGSTTPRTTCEGAVIFTDPAGGSTGTTSTMDAPSDLARRCVRRTDGKMLGGVAAGLADHLGLQPLHVRLAFIALTIIGGFGLPLYAALWVFLPQESAVKGVAGPAGWAERKNFSSGPRRRRREDTGQLVAVGVLAAGVLLLFQQWVGIPANVFWPIVLGGVGLALLWRQADEAQRARRGDSERVRWFGLLTGSGGMSTLVRSAFGVVLVIGAAVLLLASSGRISAIGEVLAAVAVGLLGVGLIVGPWVWRLAGDLTEERQERIRSQERADMAAHLHDSVLQTLALIQKQANDPKAVSRLARSQERELREWLYGSSADVDATLRSELKKAAAEVEDLHGVPVEVVAVGDAPLDDALTAVVRAAREAMTNAAKHSGAPKIDVFVEVESERIEVFVRDRGMGFDPGAVAEDRLGVRRSIYERMERHGGKADIRSSPGEGTEVKLVVDRTEGERIRT
jgi:signal transduction histidine kinase/phage shock protein PspC (stress-responsive transcriptional regulator)